ncbi:unnamed protein product, partial [Protopolystoma xenopodis]
KSRITTSCGGNVHSCESCSCTVTVESGISSQVESSATSFPSDSSVYQMQSGPALDVAVLRQSSGFCLLPESTHRLPPSRLRLQKPMSRSWLATAAEGWRRQAVGQGFRLKRVSDQVSDRVKQTQQQESAERHRRNRPNHSPHPHQHRYSTNEVYAHSECELEEPVHRCVDASPRPGEQKGYSKLASSQYI